MYPGGWWGEVSNGHHINRVGGQNWRINHRRYNLSMRNEWFHMNNWGYRFKMRDRLNMCYGRDRRYMLSDNRSYWERYGMEIGSCTFNYSVEAPDGVGCVLHDSDVAVGFDERVGALDYVTVAGLPLSLVVARVGVVYCVIEAVAWVWLENGNMLCLD